MSGLNYYYFKIWTDDMYVLIELLILFISDVITTYFDLYLPFSNYLSTYLSIYLSVFMHSLIFLFLCISFPSFS